MLMMAYAILVQFNDPDVYFWICLYAVSLVTTALIFAGYSNRSMLWMTMGLYLAAIAWLSPSFVHTSLEAFASVGMKSVQDEKVRELWGMVICAVWTAVLLLVDARRHPGYSKQEPAQDDQTEEIACN